MISYSTLLIPALVLSLVATTVGHGTDHFDQGRIFETEDPSEKESLHHDHDHHHDHAHRGLEKGYLTCGSAELSKAEKEEVEARMAETAARLGDLPRTTEVVVQTYFHNVQRADGSGGATTQMITDQISVLNAAFSGKGFQFTLAGTITHSNDAWATHSIRDQAGTDVSNAMKLATHVGDMSTLNIWACANFDNGQGITGYATFPSFGQPTPKTDGVVVYTQVLPGGSIPNYNNGNTGIHEVGHWLSLYHVFDDACTVGAPGDYVADTPAQMETMGGCTAADTCPNIDGTDSINNYMDYSFDTCQTQFTAGQISRMQLAWAAFRAPTLTSPTPAPTALGSCPSGEVVFTLQLTTDFIGWDTSWELVNACNSQAFVVGNGDYAASTTYRESYCVPSGQRYSFYIYDIIGDGLCCVRGNGAYEVFLDGTSVGSGATFTTFEVKTFGTCNVPTTTPSATPSAVPSISPSASPSVSKRPSSSPTLSLVPSTSPSSMPSQLPSKMPSGSPSVSTNPSAIPSTQPSAIPSLSVSPSAIPSSQPSASPSLSALPSSLPSNEPSVSPSVSTNPSALPSTMPSASPSDIPSQLPSASPSLSQMPSLSARPSAIPSNQPSNLPSQAPSNRPSLSPSLSIMPSQAPSDQPSQSPSLSKAPSMMPSQQPSTKAQKVEEQGTDPIPSSVISVSRQVPLPSTTPSLSKAYYPTLVPSQLSSAAGSTDTPSHQPSQSPSLRARPSMSPSLTQPQSPTNGEAPSASPSQVESTARPSMSPSLTQPQSPTNG